MKKTKVLLLACFLLLVVAFSSGCLEKSADQTRQQEISAKLESAQPTPTDVDYSLERYNLTKRCYWVNGMREKAIALPCPVSKPLGYIVLFTDNGGVVGRFVVDGKVSSLNSMLTPQSEYFELNSGSSVNKWLADTDGSYGVNDNGIFFFTPDGKYLEWTGKYLYSDIPFEVSDPIIKTQNTTGGV